ncbi:MAG: hypothetical protein JST85_22475 [Acidobacteria bacterium]|nr:hypothetical protein [Acidobacteriota bacterium]
MKTALNHLLMFTSLLSLVACLTMLSACEKSENVTKTEANAPAESTSGDSRASTLNPSDKSKPAGKPDAPIRIASMIDKTGSANQTRTQQPGADSFKPIIERLHKSGGELSVGLIRDNSNRPLLRLRIDTPPTAPVKPNDDKEDYADVLAEKQDEYDKKLRAYKREYLAWEQETERRVAQFTTDLQPLLDQPANAKRTDVFNALFRADLFLAEQEVGFKEPAQKFILLNSDCKDNIGARAKKLTLRSDAQLLVVNGVGSIGPLERFKPKLFESLDAAMRYVVKEER